MTLIRLVSIAAVASLFSACGDTRQEGCNPQCESGQDFCIDLNSGDRVNPDCTPYCPPGAVCDPLTGNVNDNDNSPGSGTNNNNSSVGNGNDNNGNGNNGNDNNNDGDPPGPLPGQCECTDAFNIEGDSDNDCITDEIENASGVSDPNDIDTDDDGVNDGCEDKNRDGVVNGEDTDPRNPDSDGDGIDDGVEDANQNGIIDLGETDGTDSDSDNDGVSDGDEDANGNGIVDPWIDNPDEGIQGCFDRGIDTPGETDPVRLDTDQDDILDSIEDANGNGQCDANETCAFLEDTDCDLIRDGREDLDADGVRDPFETDPLNVDSDSDGLPDGVEDADQNGVWDPLLETNPRDADTDDDGLSDGEEDIDGDGEVDLFTDTNGDGCYTPFDESGQVLDLPGESNPRSQDSDSDGIADNLEDADQDGLCRFGELQDPLNPAGGNVPGFEETCAFIADTDCDGISDGIEDATRNGLRDDGELDPRNPDSDFDGLPDGCREGISPPLCEDADRDGRWDREDGETNARSADTDRDGLDDGCEVTRFMPAAPAGAVSDFLDPLNEDTDGDGERDGDEDANRNCMVDDGETDPRVVNAPPAEGTEDRIEFEVCSAQRVKRLTFAESFGLDYRVAFEVERDPATDAEAEYFTLAFGFDGDGLGFNDLDPDDTPIGHLFQSPAGVIVDPGTEEAINRDVYGFVIATEDGRPLDVILDELRDELEVFSLQNGGALEENGAITSRPAHDDLPRARVLRAQRQLAISFSAVQTSAILRNSLLESVFLDTSLLDQSIFGQPDSPPVPARLPEFPTADLVYGNISCSSTPELCSRSYNLSVGAVQRLNQIGVNGQPITLLVAALTPDDRDLDSPSAAVNRLYPEKLIRLEDITGGSAVARFAAETGTTCEREQQALAKADVLWVVDDSRSMQQIIDKLQQAAEATQTVFTANSNIVDYRLAMTTTNASQGARRICPNGCRPDGTNEFGTACNTGAIRPIEDGGLLGCIQVCPENCTETCENDGGTCDLNVCGLPSDRSCVARNDMAALGLAVAADAATFPLPGGGGTFFYEDSFYMDCASDSIAVGGLESCGVAPYRSEFEAFYPGTVTASDPGSLALLDNAGFIGASIGEVCADFTSDRLAPVDLSFDTSAAGDCASNPLECCNRLVEACGHGPTVLASQMCDLIRAMGGNPQIVFGEPDTGSVGRRPHSAPELGSTQARRLLESALPAVPEDLATRGQLRLNCESGDENCPTGGCMPGETFAGSGDDCEFDFECGEREVCQSQTCVGFCDIVPVLTVFLSDEEDFFFKDDCAGSYDANPGESDWVERATTSSDQFQLASECRYAEVDEDGNLLAIQDPNTIEPCLTEIRAAPDADETVPYCSIYESTSGVPTGYDPTFAPDFRSGVPDNTVRWRDPFAPECAPDNPLGCSIDPCAVAINEGECLAPQITLCPGGECDTTSACTWTGTQCVSPCQQFNRQSGVDFAVQEESCNAVAIEGFEGAQVCQWRPELTTDSTEGVATTGLACQFVYPLNDCQPCKRERRRMDAVMGTDGVVGFGELGPVYAVTRVRGEPGAPGDACEGGPVTWGRGDGSAYRDLAIDTLGRVQDVCADSYQGFVQDIVRDIVSLSAPYPLNGFPISATIRVGIGRDTDGNGSLEFFEVPRSNTSGFTFDPTTNSLGFKSDPIDGVCAPTDSCSADGVIEQSEVAFAVDAEQVPREGDVIYVSYRFWEPVPCEESCGDGETCVRVLCPDEGGTGVSCELNADCQLNEVCDSNQCVLDCTPGDTIDRCILEPCGICETFNPQTGTCIPIADTCECNTDPDAIFCQDSSSCPPGFACLEDSCVCTPVASCSDDVLNLVAGGGLVSSLAACEELADCCGEVAAQDATCRLLQIENCTSDPGCVVDTGQCVSVEPLCCPPGDSFECQQDAESPFFFTECVPGECSCEFDANGGGDCSADTDCFQACTDFAAPNCPTGCVDQGGVCVNAEGSTGPVTAFQPRQCDLNERCEGFSPPDCPGGCLDDGSSCVSPSAGRCVCNTENFFCEPNTPIGCDCRARPF